MPGNWGRKGIDDGFILLIAKDNPKALRRLMMLTGHGVQGALTDKQSKRILRNIITPYFIKNDYYGDFIVVTAKAVDLTEAAPRGIGNDIDSTTLLAPPEDDPAQHTACLFDGDAEDDPAKDCRQRSYAPRTEVKMILEGSMPLPTVLNSITSRNREHELFAHYRILDTEENVGVLLYVNLADHRVEIVVDHAGSSAFKSAEVLG